MGESLIKYHLFGPAVAIMRKISQAKECLELTLADYLTLADCLATASFQPFCLSVTSKKRIMRGTSYTNNVHFQNQPIALSRPINLLQSTLRTLQKNTATPIQQ